jgi:hypothetical protein
MLMPFSFAARARPDFTARTTDTPEVPFYPSDFLPAMQGLLAALADLETHHEIERERLAQEAGSADEKQRLIAELEVNMGQWRERLVLRLAQLQNRMR